MAKLPWPVRNMARYAFGQVWAKTIFVPDPGKPGQMKSEKVGVLLFDKIETQFGDMLNAMIPQNVLKVLDSLSKISVDLNTGEVVIADSSAPHDSG